MFKNFIHAVQFLTIFTIRKNHPIGEGDLAKSMVYFPVVGFLIGVILVYADLVFSWIALPHSASNVLLLLIMVLVTRALHLDGLADTCDGLMGGTDRASRLAIMKDSRIGTAGTLGIVFALLLKYVCLNGLDLFGEVKNAALLTMPILSRWSQAIMVFRSNYGRDRGMGHAFVGHLRTSGLIAVSTIAIGLSAFVIVRDLRTALLAVSAVIGAVLFTFFAKRYLVRKTGGVTGDAIGAVTEMNEVLSLLIFVALTSGG